MLKSLFPVAALTLFLTLSAQAGVTIIQSVQKLDDPKSEPTNNTIRLDKDCIRIETGKTPQQYFIYRGDKKVFWMVNIKDLTYTEMTEKDFEEMSAKMEDAKKKMAAQMEKMPPEQKKMMAEMMAKITQSGQNAPKTTFKKIGSGGKINGWNTEKYEGIREGAKQSEIWTTTPKSLNITESDIQVFKDMAKFFEKFSKNMEGMIGDKNRNGLDGVPVKTISFLDGKPEYQSEMKEVKKESLPANLFDLPEGLTQKKLDMGKTK